MNEIPAHLQEQLDELAKSGTEMVKLLNMLQEQKEILGRVLIWIGDNIDEDCTQCRAIRSVIEEALKASIKVNPDYKP